MTEDFRFSSALGNNAALDEALADIERAMQRFEQIMTRHRSGLEQVIRQRQGGAGRLILGSAGRIFDLFSGRMQGSGQTVFNPNAQKNNRFSVSSGQMLADLAAAIRGISGRNL